MRLYKIRYTLVGDLQLPASPFAAASKTEITCLSILLAESLEQAKVAIRQWRAAEFAGSLWNPDLKDVTYDEYYVAEPADAPELIEVSSGESRRPLLIRTSYPQEIHFSKA